MRISDWSSDVCSSDLLDGQTLLGHLLAAGDQNVPELPEALGVQDAVHGVHRAAVGLELDAVHPQDRKSVVSGKSVSVRVDLGGRRIIKKKKNAINTI